MTCAALRWLSLAAIPVAAALADAGVDAQQQDSLSRARLFTAANQAVSEGVATPSRDTLIAVLAEYLAFRGSTDSAIIILGRATNPDAHRHLIIRQQLRINDASGIIRVIASSQSPARRSELIGSLPHAAMQAGRLELLLPVAAALSPGEALGLLAQGIKSAPSDSLARNYFLPELLRLARANSTMSRTSTTFISIVVSAAALGELSLLRELDSMSDRLSHAAIPPAFAEAAAMLRVAGDARADSLYERAWQLSSTSVMPSVVRSYWSSYIPRLSDSDPLRYLPQIEGDFGQRSFLVNVVGYHLSHDSVAVPMKIMRHLLASGDTAEAIDVLDAAIDWRGRHAPLPRQTISRAALALADTMLRIAEASGDTGVIYRARSMASFAYREVDTVRAGMLTSQTFRPDPTWSADENSVIGLLDGYPDSAFAVTRRIANVGARDELLFRAIVDQYVLRGNFTMAGEAAQLIQSPRLRNRALLMVGAENLLGGDTARVRSLVAEAISTLDVQREKAIVANELSMAARKVGMLDNIVSWALSLTGEARNAAIAALLRGFLAF